MAMTDRLMHAQLEKATEGNGHLNWKHWNITDGDVAELAHMLRSGKYRINTVDLSFNSDLTDHTVWLLQGFDHIQFNLDHNNIRKFEGINLVHTQKEQDQQAGDDTDMRQMQGGSDFRGKYTKGRSDGLIR
jgi:hypothetical protein